jgi:hypothetical protein
MVYAEQQRRERYVSVFDLAAFASLRVARFFEAVARRVEVKRAAQLAKRPEKDARRLRVAQAPPRASAVRMRDDVEVLRAQRLL